MSNDWRNHWRKSRWVTIADFPLLSLDINPATYEGGHADAGCRGNDLLKQAFASDDERVGIKLRMRTQPGNPQHKARHLLRLACRPGEYQPDEMDREVFLQDAIAFAVSEGWEVPDWLHALSPVSSHSGANELAQAKARIAELEVQLDQFKEFSQDLSGKSRTTALKIIGGLVIGAYKMRIHDARLNGIAEVMTDLERAGVTVTEKTLSTWIKQAASVIEPPKHFRP
ncbi:hypothetical protein [Aquabacterium sp.]|uniref:hypothetical protein n=1 Tax=Aquabacterium sp. TaxID=1872578 RepID=UPI0026250ACD|nr:hypothetical protein [Aquabacterium sp.]MDD2978063.1 hypothetical protein [Aquabacterium sp.]